MSATEGSTDGIRLAISDRAIIPECSFNVLFYRGANTKICSFSIGYGVGGLFVYLTIYGLLATLDLDILVPC
jgi:hypothetical protein